MEDQPPVPDQALSAPHLIEHIDPRPNSTLVLPFHRVANPVKHVRDVVSGVRITGLGRFAWGRWRPQVRTLPCVTQTCR